MPLDSSAEARSGQRARRSHAERSAETRAAVLAAVRRSVAEVGFERTTANEVARRAGVTWGAVQHHFGGKEGMLVAVVEDSFERFAERVAGVPREGALADRVAAFVAGAWAHFASDHYHSTHEILLHFRAREPGTLSWQRAQMEAWDRLWREIFHDAPLPPERQGVLQRFTIASLAGFATLRALGGEAARFEPELALLQRTLLRELSGSGPSA